MKTFVTTMLFVLSTMNIVAQSNTVKGKVVDNTNAPLIGVNVFIKGTDKGSETDFDGNFIITNAPEGKQTLVVSFIGYKTKEISITVPSSGLDITLYEGNEILQEVVISSRNNKFSRKKTAYVSKLPLKDLENSQVYTTVTSEILESQVVTNFDDALKNATGVSKLWEATGRSGDGTGYYSIRGFNAQPGLIDGVPGYTFSAIDPSYIERIEVLKGPSATLFGSTVPSIGGLINMVTKKPYEGTGGSASYTVGSFGLSRVTADVNAPLSETKPIFFRLNTSYLTQDSFQDAGFKRNFFVAPSITYRVNNRLNLSFGIEYSRSKQTNPSMLFVRRGNPLLAKNVKDLGVDPKKSFTTNDLFLTNPTFTTRAIADYKISDNWTSQTIMASSNTQSRGYYQYLIEGAAGAFAGLPVPPIQAAANQLLTQNLFTRIVDKRDAEATTFNLQQNFTGDFKIGDFRNRLVVGLDYVYRSQESRNKSGNPELGQTPLMRQIVFFLNQNGQQAQANLLLQRAAAFPYFDAFLRPDGTVVPTPFTPNGTYRLTRAKLDPIFDKIPVNHLKRRSRTYAAYVSNVINITPELTAMIGLRIDHFDEDGNLADTRDDYTKTTFSPKAGIVYQAIPNKLSVFTNYQTGFVYRPSVIQPNGTVVTFDPQKAKQFEGGVKTNFLGGRLNFGVNYYHITLNDRPSTDPRVPALPVNIVLDEVISKGLEFEVNANPIPGLHIRGSYAYNDSKITKVSIAELQDRRPEEAGPKSIYNFWADYKFQEGTFLQKFGLGAGFNGASEYHTINNGISGQFTLPKYTIFNASVYYDAEKFRVGIKGNNLTDKVYYNGWSTINPQAPRSFVGTVVYKF